MRYVTVGAENGADTRICYEDHGSGQPGGAHPRLPLNAHSRERQERVLLAAGYRVIAYDRRRFASPAGRRWGTTTTPSPPT
jgi:non-heme chloroperoxidase